MNTPQMNRQPCRYGAKCHSLTQPVKCGYLHQNDQGKVLFPLLARQAHNAKKADAPAADAPKADAPKADAPVACRYGAKCRSISDASIACKFQHPQGSQVKPHKKYTKEVALAKECDKLEQQLRILKLEEKKQRLEQKLAEATASVSNGAA